MIKLRKYKLKDWEAIATIHDRARLDELKASVGVEAFLSLAETAEDEELFEGEVLVAEDDDLVVGFVAIDSEVTWITWLYVLPDCYRQGIERKLLRLAIANCKNTVYVSVLSGNDAALKLYQSEGFKIVETKTGKLNGHESFSATGHILALRSPTVLDSLSLFNAAGGTLRCRRCLTTVHNWISIDVFKTRCMADIASYRHCFTFKPIVLTEKCSYDRRTPQRQPHETIRNQAYS